jgi:hypothetical protein
MLFTRVALHTKSKGVPIDAPHMLYYFQHTLTKSKGLRRYVLQIYYFINQVSRSFRSSAGIIIPLYHPNNKPSDLDQQFNILLIYNCYQYMRSKGHLFIFI